MSLIIFKYNTCKKRVKNWRCRKDDDNNSNLSNININCKCNNHLHRQKQIKSKNKGNQFNINLDNITLWSNSYSIKKHFFFQL